MRLKPLFLFTALTLLATACNKNADLIYTGDKLYTVRNCISGVNYTYAYNGDGAIISIQESTGNKTTYTYVADTIFMQTFNSANILTGGYTYWLNNKKALVDTARGISQLQNLSYSYSYTTDDHLLQRKSYAVGNLSAIDNYNIVSKNISYIEHLNPNTNTHTFDRYDYFASNGNTLGNQSIGQSFLGVQTGNLIRSNSKVNNNGDTTDIITYRYHFDGSSRADTMATYNKNGQRVDSMIYTYY